jgi:peptidoglycan LD-endopeptidase LytH
MTRKGREAGPLIAALVALWAAVAMRGGWLCGGVPAPLASMAHAGDPTTSGAPNDAAITTLRHRRLRLPIDNAAVERLEGMFARTRDGNPPHEAVDIVAPRDTPIHAVEDGTIARLFTSNAGGLTIYQFDPDQRFSYYYAHLERYAPGLAEGQRVMRGDVIGFVGTSGNAPPDTPHLHFAIFELEAERQWWSGRPIDPYRVFK